MKKLLVTFYKDNNIVGQLWTDSTAFLETIFHAMPQDISWEYHNSGQPNQGYTK